MYPTRKQIIVGFFAAIVMLIIGVIIADKISDMISDTNAKYNKAIKIDSKDMFEYGMRTSIGNAFVYGTLEAIDTVSYSEIDGEYSYIEKVKERYTMHTRTVTTTVNGRTRTHTQVYWSWDRVGSEEKKTKEVKFLDSTFNYSQFITPSADYLKTIKESSHIRYKYYIVPKTVKGTIFANLKNDNIGSDVYIYRNMKPQEAYEEAKMSNFALWMFWIVWIFIVCLGIYVILYNDLFLY